VLGHVGLNVPDLDAARRYYSAVMPLAGFEVFLDAEDEFAYRPAGGKPGTYLCADQHPSCAGETSPDDAETDVHTAPAA
jgi:catechol 2,3-dioxygenase-like lactoylglutathione lyase family enzyme